MRRKKRKETKKVSSSIIIGIGQLNLLDAFQPFAHKRSTAGEKLYQGTRYTIAPPHTYTTDASRLLLWWWFCRRDHKICSAPVCPTKHMPKPNISASLLTSMDDDTGFRYAVLGVDGFAEITVQCECEQHKHSVTRYHSPGVHFLWGLMYCTELNMSWWSPVYDLCAPPAKRTAM